MYLSKFFGAFALASSTYAQNATYCPGSGVCYTVNVPESTASSGTGDMFFQISGPTTLSWIGLGQGEGMKGANIFMAYSNAAGTNVTVSPRVGVGEQEPKQGSVANVTLLSGSGIANGMMTANVKCSNCSTWSGGSMSFTDSSSKWIYSYKTGSPVNSDNVALNLPQHSTYGTTTFNLQAAAGGSSANPFTTAPAMSSSNSSSPGSSGGKSSSSSTPPDFMNVRFAHGSIAAIAFVLFFPFGSIIIRAFSFKNLIWVHAAWMIFTYSMTLAALGMGVWMAVKIHKIDKAHAIIGLIVIGSLLFQPVTGLAHHLRFKRNDGRPNVATYPHIWWGRAIITLGMINGGLGLRLTTQYQPGTWKGEIVYGVFAGISWLTWMVVVVIAFIKSRGVKEGENGERIIASDGEKQSEQQSVDDTRHSSYSAPGDAAAQPGRAV